MEQLREKNDTVSTERIFDESPESLDCCKKTFFKKPECVELFRMKKKLLRLKNCCAGTYAVQFLVSASHPLPCSDSHVRFLVASTSKMQPAHCHIFEQECRISSHSEGSFASDCWRCYELWIKPWWLWAPIWIWLLATQKYNPPRHRDKNCELCRTDQTMPAKTKGKPQTLEKESHIGFKPCMTSHLQKKYEAILRIWDF